MKFFVNCLLLSIAVFLMCNLEAVGEVLLLVTATGMICVGVIVLWEECLVPSWKRRRRRLSRAVAMQRAMAMRRLWDTEAKPC